MSAYPLPKLISVCDYLEGELVSPIKHEYLGGVVYAMAGATNRHNRIALSLLTSLSVQLRGKPCQPRNSDTKIRIRTPTPTFTQTRFYYPDASVVCEPNPLDDSYEDRPVVIAEVINESTRRTDEGEKRDAYFTLPSLRVLLLIEQERPLVVAFRRREGAGGKTVGVEGGGEGGGGGEAMFARELYHGLDATIPLDEIDARLPLADLYENVSHPPSSTPTSTAEPSTDEPT